jgi:glutamyl-tRNA reductase
MNIFLFGLNHKSAPVEVREKLAFTKDELYQALELAQNIKGIKECMILSTCNRTEIYTLLDPSAEGLTQIKELLISFGKWQDGFDEKFVYTMHNSEAICHLFRVTAGLDSMVLGEPQIQGQVKDAFEMAMELKSAQSIFSRLYQMAMITGKKVRTETGISRGAVSIAYAATELAQKIFRSLENKSALLIGAGETGELTAIHLKEKGIKNLYITNRTFEKAKQLAAKLGGEPLPFEDFPQLLSTIDVVISSTGSPEPVVHLNNAGTYLSRRKMPIFFIDIAVPRDIDPAISRFELVFLHNIDSLNQIVEKNLAKRKSELPKAENIIRTEVNEFLSWYESLSIKPFIRDLKEYLENLREQELKKSEKKIPDNLQSEINYLTQRIVNKIFHNLVSSVRDGNPDMQQEKIALLREIFNLEKEKEVQH